MSPRVTAQEYDFSAIDSVLDANAATLRNKVVVMLRHNGNLVYYRGIGIDSTEQGQIASMTKSLSAALILRLAQEGKLGLDDSLGMYKPFASTLGKGGCTVRQNFSHTAGWTGTSNYLSDRTLTLQESADSIITHDAFLYAPGTAFRYTGVSMHVGGAIAELATAERWNDLFRDRIAEPLGMPHTTYCLTTEANPRIAGGMCSTPADLMRFGEFIRRNGKNEQGSQVVDSVWMQELWRDQTRSAPQLASPYPYHPGLNNPYQADTIRYGFGTWLDIVHPSSGYQEQISGAGAFGTHVWVNRCHNLTGVFFTPPPVLNRFAEPVAFAIMDIARKQTPYDCGEVSLIETFPQKSALSVFPNPFHSSFTISATSAEEFYITDPLGRVVRSGTVLDRVTLDISNVSRGVYFLHTVHGTQTLLKL